VSGRAGPVGAAYDAGAHDGQDGTSGAVPRYQLVTRAGCHLCDEMAALLDQAMGARGLAYEAIDVDAAGNEALRQRFGETVPVLLRDGVPVAKVRLDHARLERILDRRR
jgi:hypothetical protein